MLKKNLNGRHLPGAANKTSITAEVLTVCRSGAFRCLLTQCWWGKTAEVFDKELLVLIALHKVISKPFQIHHSTVLIKSVTFKGPIYHMLMSNVNVSEGTFIPTVKHGGGGVMIWVYFRARGPGHLVVNESVMNSSVYRSFLESEVIRSVTAKACLKLGY